MKNNKRTEVNTSSEARSRRVFIIFTAAFLGLVLVIGAVFGVIGIVNGSTSVMRFKGVYLKEGVSNYLASTYKYDFMSSLTRAGVECYDSEHFWESEAEEGKTWGEILKENTESYLKRVIIGSYLFDRNTGLKRADKDVIEKATSEVLEYRTGGDVDRFNEMAEPMGFTYRDFKRAAEMLYKYEMAKTVIFGYDGAALKSGSFSRECNEYFEKEYSKVKLIIIRTEGDFATDPETGDKVYSEFDEDKKAEIQEKIEEIRELIYNTENDLVADGMNEDTFNWYIANEFPTGTVNDTEGYYFSSSSSYSLEFAEDAPEVVKKALGMEVGHYAEAELDIGVCFIYKCPLDRGAYDRIAVAHFFSDFYENAASYVYSVSVEAYLGGVTVKDKYDGEKVVSVPYNNELLVKFN